MTTPIKILFLAANPQDMDPLQLNQESRAIDLALRGSAYRDRFALEDHWAVQVGDLQDLLLRHEPDILHFSGHGTEENEIVTLSGNGTVVAGATDYGTFFNLYGFGRHTITLPGSYTFCWPGRAPGGYGFETVVQAQSTSDRITNIRVEYLGACQ